MSTHQGRTHLFAGSLRLGLTAYVAACLLTGCSPEREQPRQAVSAPTSDPAVGQTVVVRLSDGAGAADLGVVAPGSRHRVTFVLRNSGPRPLEVRKVRTSCECATVVSAPSSIPPGGEGQIQVDFVAPVPTPSYVSEVVVLTDDPDRPLLPLSIRARIEQEGAP